MNQDVRLRRAFKLWDIPQAVPFNEPIGPEHEFFTDFSDVRGEFEERIVYQRLNVRVIDGKYTFDAEKHSNNKVLLFLGGMRGSGKTSELVKYAYNLHKPECFFCVTCNIDQGLDMNSIEYMDILIFQLEQLTLRLKEAKVKIHHDAVNRLQTWFAERNKEVTQSTSVSSEVEIGVGAEKGGLLGGLLGLLGHFKAGLNGSKEWVESTRSTLKNRFGEFANRFNEFVAEANIAIRKQKLGQEVLFVVDGLEKTNTSELRKRIIVDESNRLSSIKAYTIFTLPIELMRERERLAMFSKVESFPFVKLCERDGSLIPRAIGRFEAFIFKRIDESLFESRELIRELIMLSGGSPRELLKILDTASLYADETVGKIDRKTVDRTIKSMASKMGQYLTEVELLKLKKIKELNANNEPIPYDEVVQELLEKIILMEYNDGSDKRPNPIITKSEIYRAYVG